MAQRKTFSGSIFLNSSRLTATASISLVLFMLGILLFLSIFAAKLSTIVRESMSIDIVLADNATEQQITQTVNRLQKAPFASAIRFISKEEAAKEVEKETGENPEVFLGFNPLPQMVVVNLKSGYTHPDSIPSIEKYVRSYANNVSAIEYRQDLLQTTNKNLTKAGAVVFSLSAILLLISLALINNTVRLSVYSKRFLIHTMQLVGATAGFIRRPFIRSFVVYGIIAALLANIFLTGLLYYFTGSFDHIRELAGVDLLIVFACVFAMGIIISATAAYFAVNRYISMKSDDMYYI
jgi:cell division transport system permease protein